MKMIYIKSDQFLQQNGVNFQFFGEFSNAAGEYSSEGFYYESTEDLSTYYITPYLQLANFGASFTGGPYTIYVDQIQIKR